VDVLSKAVRWLSTGDQLQGGHSDQRDSSGLEAKGVGNLADADRGGGAAQSGGARMGGLLRPVLPLEVSGYSGPLSHRVLSAMGDAEIQGIPAKVGQGIWTSTSNAR
jgi:hypothetical protein